MSRLRVRGLELTAWERLVARDLGHRSLIDELDLPGLDRWRECIRRVSIDGAALPDNAI